MIAAIFISVFVGVSGISFSEKEHLLPALFHLDNYERCLSQKDGLYCLGTFELYPDEKSNPTYNLIEEFSREITNFNRTLIHRGYCVSARCPSDERNASARFERCVAKTARDISLRTKLRSLDFCRSKEEAKRENTFDSWQVVYAYIIGVIVLLNIIGTIYDIKSSDKIKRNSLLLAWSIRYNWGRLTVDEYRNNPGVSSAHGVRVLVMVLVILVHCGMLQHTIYLQNPLFVEEMIRDPWMMLIQNGTSFSQLYALLSSFLGAYYLCKSSPDGSVGFYTTIKHVLKRIFRLLPVHMLVVGFVATWWPIMGAGPLWTPVVEVESIVCRKKIWSQLLFISNLVNPNEICLLPTWFICADLQMYVIGAVATYALAKVQYAIPILISMFLVSCSGNAVLAYIYNWKSMMYIVQSPENVRILFRKSPSHYNFYISPWGGLPTCFLGLIAAHYLAKQSKKEKPEESKIKPGSNWTSVLSYFGAPVVIAWLLLGNLIKHVTSRLFLSVYAAVERVIFLSLAVIAFGIHNKGGCVKTLFTWRGWYALSRLSFPVMLIHWVLALHLLGQRSRTYDMTVFNMGIDGVAVGFYSYLLAVPVSILVEMPVQKFLDVLFFKK